MFDVYVSIKFDFLFEVVMTFLQANYSFRCQRL